MTPPKRQQGVLIIVENLPVPFDRRVWQEATALKEAGYGVSVICPKGKGYNQSEEVIDGINIYRHNLPFEASSGLGYLVEYSAALFWEFLLSVKVLRRHGFDIIHACNPPDLIYLIASFYKIFFGKKFIFDQHDLNPELYEVKFGKRGHFHTLLSYFERRTFRWADASIATNQTFKKIAIERGGMKPGHVWIVKSYPDFTRFKRTEPSAEMRAGFKYLVGYVGIIAEQDGVDLLVKAMAHIVKHHKRTDSCCVVIGDGPALEAVKALAKSLGVESHVKFTGYLRGEALMTTLSSMAIGVIPDPPHACNNKLSMNKVFEYMSLGLPFVQFDLPQSGSEAGSAALVAADSTPEALATSILQLLDDPAARKRMSIEGRSMAERDFQWANEKQSLLAAYAHVLGDPA
jgi:glycosyltransferase involved in cell wall biosynthesis